MDLSEELIETLLGTARKARENAFPPFSHFPVGAAVLTSKGTMFSGCNIENASFGLTVCAERVAIFKAISEGEKDFLALAISAPIIVPPCGACLQVLSQFVSSPEEFLIISCDEEDRIAKWTLVQLFPHPFSHF